REFLATVADLHHEQAREPVDIALALVVEDVHALAAGDDRRGDARTVPRAMAPQVAVRFACQGARYFWSDFSCRHLVPQLYCCLTSFRYTSVSVDITPGSARIWVLSRSSRSSSSSQTTSMMASKEPAVSTTYSTALIAANFSATRVVSPVQRIPII